MWVFVVIDRNITYIIGQTITKTAHLNAFVRVRINLFDWLNYCLIHFYVLPKKVNSPTNNIL